MVSSPRRRREYRAEFIHSLPHSHTARKRTQVSNPMAQYRFADGSQGEFDTDAARFISAVCWKGDSTEMLAANSQGQIRVLRLSG